MFKLGDGDGTTVTISGDERMQPYRFSALIRRFRSARLPDPAPADMWARLNRAGAEIMGLTDSNNVRALPGVTIADPVKQQFLDYMAERYEAHKRAFDETPYGIVLALIGETGDVTTGWMMNGTGDGKASLYVARGLQVLQADALAIDVQDAISQLS